MLEGVKSAGEQISVPESEPALVSEKPSEPEQDMDEEFTKMLIKKELDEKVAEIEDRFTQLVSQN